MVSQLKSLKPEALSDQSTGCGSCASSVAADYGCDSEAELLGNLRWLRDACAQAGEQFDDDDTLVPGAVTTRGCAGVVRRVAGDCGGLLARSPWFASRRAALDALPSQPAEAALEGSSTGSTRHCSS